MPVLGAGSVGSAGPWEPRLCRDEAALLSGPSAAALLLLLGCDEPLWYLITNGFCPACMPDWTHSQAQLYTRHKSAAKCLAKSCCEWSPELKTCKPAYEQKKQDRLRMYCTNDEHDRNLSGVRVTCTNNAACPAALLAKFCENKMALSAIPCICSPC